MQRLLLLLAVAASYCQASPGAPAEAPTERTLGRVAALLPPGQPPLRLFPNDFDSGDQVGCCLLCLACA